MALTGTPLELIAVEVRADIDQLVRDMPAAARVVDQSMDQIDRSVKSTERAVVVSSGNMGQAMARTGGVSRVLGQQLSQVGQQALATGNVFQALAIQLPDIALGMSAAAGEASAFARFLGGPWGTALVLAVSVAAAFIPKLLGIGEAADKSEDQVDALTAAINRLKKAQGGIGDVGQAEARIAALQSERLGLTNDTSGNRGGANRRAARIKEIDAEIASTRALVSWNAVEAQGKKDIAEAEEKASKAKDKGAKSSKGKSDADREAAKAAREAAQAQKELERTLETLVGRFDPARQAATRFRDTLADIDRLVGAGKLGAGEAIGFKLKAAAEQAKAIADAAAAELKATLGFTMGGDDDPLRKMFAQWDKDRDQRERAEFEADERIAAHAKDLQENQIRTMATLYEDAFRGGTDAIWGDFKEIGLRVIAQVLAKFTLAQVGGGGFDLGSAIGGAFTSVLGFASGGSMTIGGRGGTDRNTLSLNGRPIANVSRGEKLSVGRSGGSGGPTIVQHITVDASNSVNPDGFAREILAIAGQQAQHAAATMGRGVLKAVPTRVGQFQRDGT